MNLLVKQAVIFSPDADFHLQKKDILILNGVIDRIDNDIPANEIETFSRPNLHVSIGWTDIFADFSEPGNEHRETLYSGAKAAAAGGFTKVFVIPNTNPVISDGSAIQFLKEKSKSLPVNIYPTGTITKNADGIALAEMYEMYHAGAIAFSDGKKPLQSASVLIKALEYIIAKNAVIIQMPVDKAFSETALMNEGIESTKLGLPGTPAVAEEIMIGRDIELARSTASKVHITGVSTAKGIELIARAKNEGVKVSCSVTPHHLFFCDEDLFDYDTNLKVDPPLRSRADMVSLRRAVDDGLVDCFASHHFPQHADDKNCEFELAKKGMINLESLFGAVSSVCSNIGRIMEMLCYGPKIIFDLNCSAIEVGENAQLTFFNPAEEYFFEPDMIRSFSRKSPFIGKKLRGRVFGIFNNNQLVLNS